MDTATQAAIEAEEHMHGEIARAHVREIVGEQVAAGIFPLTVRERDTILAALRYWKREGVLSDGHERDIAEENGDALTGDEIDELCAMLNGEPTRDQ